MDQSSFYRVIDEFQKLPGIIDELSVDSFTSVMQSNEAKEAKNIVYLWRTNKKISRLNGESDILYIGQTKNSFATRYKNHHQWINTKANSLKYLKAIKGFNGISIYTCDFTKFGETLLKAEGQLLWWYFQNHCEYPPFNYTKTKIRNDYYP